MALRVAVTGASGRMGQSVARAVFLSRDRISLSRCAPGGRLLLSSATSIVGEKIAQ